LIGSLWGFIFILAKIHCLTDSDCINTLKDVACLSFSIILQPTEKTIRERNGEFIDEMFQFGMV